MDFYLNKTHLRSKNNWPTFIEGTTPSSILYGLVSNLALRRQAWGQGCITEYLSPLSLNKSHPANTITKTTAWGKVGSSSH